MFHLIDRQTDRLPFLLIRKQHVETFADAMFTQSFILSGYEEIFVILDFAGK